MDSSQNNEPRMKSASFVSPILWKQSAASDDTRQMVTLNLRPFRTTNLSLNTFMASHCPTRNCGNKQKFMLKPIEQMDSTANIQSPFGRNSPTSFSAIQTRLLQGRGQSVRPSSSCSKSKELSASVVTLGAQEASQQYHGMVPDGICALRNNSFRPSAKLSQATGQKIQVGNPFNFNYKSGYFNLLQQADIVARGMPVITQKKEEQIKPTQSGRWKSKSEHYKASNYVDPVIGASDSFQERLAEITQHELDTVKWERAKKGRKKTVPSS